MTPAAAALLAFLPWLQGGATPLGLFVTQTLVAVLLLMALGRRQGEAAGVLLPGRLTAAALVFAAVCALSLLRSAYLFGSLMALVEVATALVLAATMTARGTRGWLVLARTVCAAGAIEAVIVLLQARPENLTRSGTFANANQLAAWLNVAILVSIGLSLDARRGGRRLEAGTTGGAALLGIAAVIPVGSRGAAIALLAAAASWIAAAVPPGDRRRMRWLWGGVILLAILAAVAVASRFRAIEDPYRFERPRIWKAAFDVGLDHPVLGVGPGNFGRVAGRYNFPLDDQPYRFSKVLGSAHSSYLQTFAETGLAGAASLFLLLLLLAPLLWRLLRGDTPGLPRHAPAAAAAGATACLVHGMVDTPFSVPAVTLTLVALVAPLLAAGATVEGGGARIRFGIPPRGAPGRRSAILALAALLVTAWAGAVLLPYAAHVVFERGWTQSRPGSPSPRLETAIDLNPINPLYPAARAEWRWDRSRPLDPPTLGAATLDLLEARRLDPLDPRHPLTLAQLHARACFEIGADPAAIARVERFYRDALALGPTDPRPRLELGAFLMTVGRAGEGVEQIRMALELEPRYLGARLALARAHLDAGRAEEARREMERLAGTRRELERYQPRNGYERDLMRLDETALARIMERLPR